MSLQTQFKAGRVRIGMTVSPSDGLAKHYSEYRPLAKATIVEVLADAVRVRHRKGQGESIISTSKKGTPAEGFAMGDFDVI